MLQKDYTMMYNLMDAVRTWVQRVIRVVCVCVFVCAFVCAHYFLRPRDEYRETEWCIIICICIHGPRVKQTVSKEKVDSNFKSNQEHKQTQLLLKLWVKWCETLKAELKVEVSIQKYDSYNLNW